MEKHYGYDKPLKTMHSQISIPIMLFFLFQRKLLLITSRRNFKGLRRCIGTVYNHEQMLDYFSFVKGMVEL